MICFSDLDSNPMYQVMPKLLVEEYEALKEDIKQRGVQVPIECDEDGNILDGYHRFHVWRTLRDEGINVPEPEIRVREGLSEEEKLEHAHKLNTHRRQLTREWKQQQALQLRQNRWTQQRISDALGVPQQTLSRWFAEFTKMGKLDASQPVTGRDGKLYPATRTPSARDIPHDDTTLSPLGDEDVPTDIIEMTPVEDTMRNAAVDPERGPDQHELPLVSELLMLTPTGEPNSSDELVNEDTPEDKAWADTVDSRESIADGDAPTDEPMQATDVSQGMTPDATEPTRKRRPEPTIEAQTHNGYQVYVVTGEAEHPVFNRELKDSVGWSGWTWNPVTGCLGPGGNGICDYCYAKGIACRLYDRLPEDIRFAPIFHPDRLAAPGNTKVSEKSSNPNSNLVFVCSMGDLFGEWVPQEWIDAVLQAVTDFPQWTYLFLTKNPERLVGIDWPANAWVGTTVDVQSRVALAEEAFRQIQAPIKFVSCEPLLEPVTFTTLDIFDWVIVGAKSKTPTQPEFQPKPEWVIDLWKQALDADCKVYLKSNLSIVKQYPQVID